jgi:hypothetical protein
MHKSELIVQMLRARDDWEQLINFVGLSRVGIGGVSGHWSVKNIVAHVMSREQHMADRLSELARGGPVRKCQSRSALDAFVEEFGYPDFDSPLLSEEEANEWIFQKYRNAPMKELVADELHAFDLLLASLRLIPEETLDELGLMPRVRHVTVEHYRLHAADIRKRFKRPLRQL